MRPRRAAAAAALAALALSGCAPGAGGPFGASPPPVRVIEAGPDGARIDAAGREVAVAPPPGRCVSEDAVAGRSDAAFLMIGDCAPGEGGPIAAVTIGAGPLFGADGADAAFAALEAWSATPAGLRDLGMGGAAKDVRLVQTRRSGDALFLEVEDDGAAARPRPGVRFWRVFAEVGGRLAMLSIHDPGGEAGAPLYAEAARHLAALRAANGEAAPVGAAPPRRAAAAAAAPQRVAAAGPDRAPPPPRPR